MHDPLADHPDLNDEAWIREATRNAHRAARKQRRQRPRRRPGRPRRRNGLLVAGVVTALLLTASVVFRDDLFGGPTAAADRPPSTAVDRQRPFDGTQAEGKPDGAAGIVAPAGTAVGTHTAKQVAAAYSTVRDLLIAGRIDRRALEDRQFDQLLSQLSPESHEYVREQLDGPYALAWATVIDPGARLLPVPPKADGAMTAAVDAEGRLVVDTDYSFAYAFDLPGATSTAQIVVVLRYQTRFTMTATGPHATRAEGYVSSMSCAAMAQGRLAPQQPDDVRLVEHYEARHVDLFDRAEPLPAEGTCVNT